MEDREPDGAPMFIDTHAHLDMPDFQDDLEQTLLRAIRGGVTRMIAIGIDLQSSRRAVELAADHDFIFASVGCHPHHAGDVTSDAFDALLSLASEPKVVAWGEIGLDFFRRYAPKGAQKAAFQKQLNMAHEVQLPVIIHDREAHADVLAALTAMGKGEGKGVIHCFSGDYALAAALIDLGYYISIPGTVTYRKASQVRDVAGRIPLERLLIETDAPFLTPEPNRGRRNEPLFVTFTAAEIARLRRISVEEVGLATTRNAERLFRLPRAR